MITTRPWLQHPAGTWEVAATTLTEVNSRAHNSSTQALDMHKWSLSRTLRAKRSLTARRKLAQSRLQSIQKGTTLWTVPIRLLCSPRNSQTSKEVRSKKATWLEVSRCRKEKQAMVALQPNSQSTTQEVSESQLDWLPATKRKCIARPWQISIQTSSTRLSHKDTWLGMWATTNNWVQTRLEAATTIPFRATLTMFAVRCDKKPIKVDYSVRSTRID